MNRAEALAQFDLTADGQAFIVPRCVMSLVRTADLIEGLARHRRMLERERKRRQVEVLLELNWKIAAISHETGVPVSTVMRIKNGSRHTDCADQTAARGPAPADHTAGHRGQD